VTIDNDRVFSRRRFILYYVTWSNGENGDFSIDSDIDSDMLNGEGFSFSSKFQSNPASEH
jgi:hypothetical protein